MAPFLSSSSRDDFKNAFQTPRLSSKRQIVTTTEKISKFKRLFRPEYTSTPSYSLPKTSTPVMKRLSSSIDTIEKRSFKNYHANSTFKEEITPKKLFKDEQQPLKKFKYISSRVKTGEKPKAVKHSKNSHNIILKITSGKQCSKCRPETHSSVYRRARRNEKLMKQLIYEPNRNYYYSGKNKHLFTAATYRNDLIQLEKVNVNFFAT